MKWLAQLAAFFVILWLVRRFWLWFWTTGWKRLLQHFLKPLERSASIPAERRGTLKRDPICGTHVDVTLAVTESAGGEVMYFCSEDCRDTFLRQARSAR